MAQSSEYPDLPFVSPKAFGRGRDGFAVQYIVVHYTAGSERSTSAEDGAAYDQRRTDGTSTHYFVDSNSVVQCVLTGDRANACFKFGNRYGIQYELCGTQQTRAQWLDAASDATLTLAARQMARDCRKYGLPVRRLTVAQMRAGEKGLCGHVDVTDAYGLGDHRDPGPEFPWDVLLTRVAHYLDGDDDMAWMDDLGAAAVAWRLDAIAAGIDTVRGGPQKGEPMWLVRTVRELADRAEAGPVDVEVLAAQVAFKLGESAAFRAAVVAGVADLLGRTHLEVGGATPGV